MLSNIHIQVLLIEDEDYDVRRVENTIRPFQDRIHIRDITADGNTALDLLRRHPQGYDVVIMDFQIAGGLTGEALIRKMKAIDPALQIIVITKMTTHVSDFDFANRLLNAGAMWFCTKYPGDIEEYIYQPTDFLLSLFNAYEKRSLHLGQLRSINKLQQNINAILQDKQIVGESEAISSQRSQIRLCAASDTTVFIRGDSGTGKELVAANIHYQSARRFERFVTINCGSLPAELIESELFGFEKGAFTGAKAEKKGLFEQADNGTVFLDEVAEMPLPAQVKLLRVIQDGELDKIGRTRKIKVNVRIIAATNKNIEEEVRAKRFREDLYYRLNVVPIFLQPLRNRQSDIPMLIHYFLQRFCERMGKEVPELHPEAMNGLTMYSWPGNIRELQNVVQRLLFLGMQEISAEQVKASIGLTASPGISSADSFSPLSGGNIRPLREVEREFRYTYILEVRKQAGSDAEAARLLGLAPPNFHRICKELGIK